MINKSKINPKISLITYDHLYQKLNSINSLLPDTEKVMPKLKEYFRWTRENYNQMDTKAKRTVGAVAHLEVELWVAKIFAETVKTR